MVDEVALVVPADVAAAPPDVRPPRRDIGSLLRTGLGVVVVLVAWELLARTVLDGRNLIAPPTGIIEATIDNWSLYLRAARTTLGEAARGFLWGNLVAAALAAIVALAPITERVVLRVALAVWCLPLVAMGPLLRVVYGTGDGPQVTLAALAVFYTTLVPVIVGLRAVPQSWTDLVSSYGRGRLASLRLVRARACVPYLFAGLQVAAPAAFLGALVGEFTGAERGMGLLTINAMRGLRTDELWAVATISALIAMAGYVIVGAIGRRLAIGQPALLMAPPPARAASSPFVRFARSIVEIAITIAVLIGMWVGLMALLDLNPYFAKRPGDVWTYLVSGPDAVSNRREILDALRSTAQVAVPGYVLGLALGATCAAAFELWPAVRRTATPFAVALRCVPIVAIAPLLVQAFGRGAIGTTTTVAIMTFFPTLVACAYGLRQTPAQVLDLYAVYDTGRVRTLLSGQVPGMAPAFFAAARIAVPATVLAATVAEWLATGTGMGNLMALTAANSRYATLWACVVVVTVIASLAYGAVTMLERVVLRRIAPEQLTW
jgi:ABC-type nitrate/sulfonate/bicarbonate transport system permease component